MSLRLSHPGLDRLLVVDLETTGIDPASGRVVDVAGDLNRAFVAWKRLTGATGGESLAP